MWRRVAKYAFVTLFSIGMCLSPSRVKAVSECTLCILEFSAGEAHNESADFVIIGNASASSLSLSSIQLQYFNGYGVYDSKYTMSGTLLPGQTKLFVSTEIKTYNTSATTLPFHLYSGGGSLRIVKVLTSSTTIYDSVGWGDSMLFEGNKISHSENDFHFMRMRNELGAVIDSGDNNTDFDIVSESCHGLYINEIQPFASDADGKSTLSWVEVTYEKLSSNDCVLATSDGDGYPINLTELESDGGIVAISSITAGDTEYYLQLPNPSGSIALAVQSQYFSDRPVLIPVLEVSYSDLLKSQSYGLFTEYGLESWKPTYQSTPGEDNYLLTSPEEIITGSPTACDNIMLNELNPNPVGSDTGSEWIEIKNEGALVENLEQCIINIDSEKYYFATGMYISPNEYQKYGTLLNEYGDIKSLSLRNTEETYVGMSRLYAGEITQLQLLSYADAPEGMSYARFSEGWAWTYTITPSLVNAYLSTKPIPIVTEMKANFSVTTKTANVGVTSSKATTSSKKSSSPSLSTKSLASTAKATTGAKATDSRDVYEPPEVVASNDSSYIFVVIGVMAVLYAIYEYKIDIQNFYFKRRRNKVLGGEDRSAA